MGKHFRALVLPSLKEQGRAGCAQQRRLLTLARGLGQLQSPWCRARHTRPASSQGASPAGGCLMALSCDYRVMADNPKYVMGLNETQLGIVAPFW